jgi:pimeloyl-ACP methyl ester carboxylesterase
MNSKVIEKIPIKQSDPEEVQATTLPVSPAINDTKQAQDSPFFPSIQSTTRYYVLTSQGKISVRESGKGKAVLFIHGNSASGKIFKKQFDSPLSSLYRLIAVDLPGHGGSDAAKDITTYSFPGYAKVLVELIETLRIEELTVVGWSLGGHVALELYLLIPGKIQGILITGAPPLELSPEGFNKAYKPCDGLELVGYESQFTEEQASLFMGLGGIHTSESFVVEDAVKALGIARKSMVDSCIKGIGANEVDIVKNMKVPLAIVAGQNDIGINNEYISQLSYGSLWKNKMRIIKNAGHAVFWENADKFNKILHSFLESIF